MRISHKYKFVFISKPRSGSTSLRAMLDTYSDILGTPNFPYHHHTTALELKLHFTEMNWDWNEYFVFTTVRNPWDMMVSYFSFFKPDVNCIYNYEKERDGIKYQGDKLSSFENWMLNGKLKNHLIFEDGELKKDIWINGFRRISLQNTICDLKNQMIVNQVIKIEDVEKELPSIFKKLNIYYSNPILKINTSEHKNYRFYYNSITKKIVENTFSFDINFGKYSF